MIIYIPITLSLIFLSCIHHLSISWRQNPLITKNLSVSPTFFEGLWGTSRHVRTTDKSSSFVMLNKLLQPTSLGIPWEVYNKPLTISLDLYICEQVDNSVNQVSYHLIHCNRLLLSEDIVQHCEYGQVTITKCAKIQLFSADQSTTFNGGFNVMKRLIVAIALHHYTK